MPKKDKTAGAILADWYRTQVREHRDAHTDVELRALATAAAKHFLEVDGLAARFINDYMYQALYDVAQRTLAPTRRLFIGNVELDQDALAAAIAGHPVFGNWEVWLERKAGGGHRLLMDMDGADLAEAEAHRRQAGNRDLLLADTWATLRKQLRKGETVKDRWKPADIDAVIERLRKQRGLEKAA